MGAAQIFDKHPGLRPLGDAIRKHVDLRRELTGRFSNPFRVWYNQNKGNAPALATAREYWEAEDSGKAAAAAAIRAQASPAAAQLIDTETKVLNDAFDLAQKEGYMVRDPQTGRFHPFKKGAHLFPRMVKQSVVDTLRNSNRVGKEYRALKDQLINSGAISAANADAEMVAIRDKVSNLTQGQRHHGECRLDALDPTADPSCMTTASRRSGDLSEPSVRALARRMALGQKTGGKGRDIFDLYHDRAGDDATKNYIRGVQANAYNERPHNTLQRVAAAFNQVATPLQLANPRSVERNLLTGLVFNMGHFGVGRTLSAMTQAFREIPEAFERGAISDDILNIMSDGERIMAEKPKLTARLSREGFQVERLECGRELRQGHLLTLPPRLGYATRSGTIRTTRHPAPAC